jgi:hypothetical protein
MGGRKKKAENLVAMSVICFLFGFATNGGLFLPILFQLVSRVVSSLITLQSLFQKSVLSRLDEKERRGLFFCSLI